MRRTATTTVIAALVAGGACSGSELAYGDPNSIIVAAPPELWEQVQDTVFGALEPSVMTTVEDEEIFRVSYQDPAHEHWGNLRKFRQMLLIGDEDNPWIAEALAKVRDRGDPALPAILFARDVWARNQVVTILLLPDDESPAAVESRLADLQDLYVEGFRRWARDRMFLSGRDSALADTLSRRAGFSLLLPEVYYWDRRDSVYIFRNDNPDPSELIRQVAVTWLSPAPPEGLDAEALLAWRERLGESYYSIAQVNDLSRSSTDTVSFDGREAFQVQAVWTNPPGTGWPAAGPFIARSVHCPGQDRLYLLDAWLYAPGRDKYEYMLQLQTILDSFRCGAGARALAPPSPTDEDGSLLGGIAALTAVAVGGFVLWRGQRKRHRTQPA